MAGFAKGMAGGTVIGALALSAASLALPGLRPDWSLPRMAPPVTDRLNAEARGPMTEPDAAPEISAPDDTAQLAPPEAGPLLVLPDPPASAPPQADPPQAAPAAADAPAMGAPEADPIQDMPEPATDPMPAPEAPPAMAPPPALTLPESAVPLPLPEPPMSAAPADAPPAAEAPQHIAPPVLPELHSLPALNLSGADLPANDAPPLSSEAQTPPGGIAPMPAASEFAREREDSAPQAPARSLSPRLSHMPADSPAVSPPDLGHQPDATLSEPGARPVETQTPPPGLSLPAEAAPTLPARPGAEAPIPVPPPGEALAPTLLQPLAEEDAPAQILTTPVN